MQGRIAAALFAGAMTLLYVPAEPTYAHGVAPAARDRDAAAPAVPAVAPNRWGSGYFPNVPLVTQDGVTVRLYDDLLKGKSVAINVMYTSCKDECPLETARLVQLQKILGERMGKDIFFYSITIDPRHDTPEVLKAYAEKFGVGPGWLFLTGQDEDIKLATKKLGLAGQRNAIRKDGHSASFMIGNEPAGLWMRNSAVDNPKFLATTIAGFLGWKGASPGASYAEARPLALDTGEYFFHSQCSVCHTIGQGEKIGPDLLGVTTRRTRAWLARYLAQPDRLLSEGDPTATALFRKYKEVRMPNLRLGAEEIDAVLSYLVRTTPRAHPPNRD